MSVSGANKALYAIRRGVIEELPSGIINKDFYIATKVQQNGYSVLFDSEAVAYENIGKQADHVRDGAGNYQAMGIFRRMLLPRKGGFTYWSHRVMKWFVPFNLIAAFISNLILLLNSKQMVLFFICHAFAYVFFICYYFIVEKRICHLTSKFAKLIAMLFYFMSVNYAMVIGFISFCNKKWRAAWGIKDYEKQN